MSTDDGAGASSSRPMGRVRCKGCDTTTSNIPDQESSVCCTGCGKIICLLCTPDINNAKPCYKPRGGIAQHQRNKHAETYHKQNIPEPVKKRWTEEDLTILAMEELNAPPGTRFINQYLHSVIPSRSTESISCQRKATHFKNILQNLKDNREMINETNGAVGTEAPAQQSISNTSTSSNPQLENPEIIDNSVDTSLDSVFSHDTIVDSDSELLANLLDSLDWNKLGGGGAQYE